MKDDDDRKIAEEKGEEEELDSEETLSKRAPKINFDYERSSSSSEDDEKNKEEYHKKETQPDTLDDLAQEDPKGEKEQEDSKIPHMKHQENTNSDIYSRNYDSPGNFSHGSGYGERTIRRSKGSPLPLIILILVGIAIVGGTVFILKNRNVNWTNNQPSPSPTAAEPTTAPTATPQAIDRSKFTVRVLNGTKTTGLAASVSAKLKDLGYKTEKTANATNSAFERTVVRVKDGNEDLSKQLIEDLKGDFDAASSSALKSSDSADGEVILGAE